MPGILCGQIGGPTGNTESNHLVQLSDIKINNSCTHYKKWEANGIPWISDLIYNMPYQKNERRSFYQRRGMKKMTTI